MSLSLTLKEAIDEVLQTFISKVATEYKLDTNELQSLWSGESITSKPTVKKVSSQPKESESKSPAKEIDPEILLKCNKAELVALCKSHGHKCSGTKTILMNRLLGKEDNTENTPKESSKPKAKSKAVKQAAVAATPIAQKLTANIPNILIRRNKFNNYEHPETGLVFDNETKVVYGKQNDNGTVDPLTDDDIDQCNAFKFKFKIPTNLDQKSTLNEVKVDELSEEEEEEEEEDLEIEEDEVELDEEEEELNEDEEELNEDELLENDDDVLGDDEEFEDYVSD